jgi:hypothetical protein
VYSINATFVTSCNTTKVRELDVIVSRPSTQINAKRISTTRIYFAFVRGRNDRPNECVMLIYVYNNTMRSCNERTTLHCVESYLYYITLVNKKKVLRSETREKINRQYTYIVENIKFWRDIWCLGGVFAKNSSLKTKFSLKTGIQHSDKRCN